MCRMVVFAGACTRCHQHQTWTELCQPLACLEAKNNGGFGKCARDTAAEEHAFDQECDACLGEDEGIGDLDDIAAGVFTGSEVTATTASTARLGKRGASEVEDGAAGKKQKI